MDSERVDLSQSYRRFGNNRSFTLILAEHRDQMDILEYEPHKYINIRLLEKCGFDRDRLRTYGDRIMDYVSSRLRSDAHPRTLLRNSENQDVYFTTYSLRRSGYADELDMLGMGDLFAASILKLDKRFSWQRIGGVPVFNLNKTFFETSMFLRAYVMEAGSVSVSDLTDQLIWRFGIPLKRHVIMEKGRCGDTYYDPVMDKLYVNHDVFEDENMILLSENRRNNEPEFFEGDEPLRSGFDCPVYGVVVPKGYTFEEGENGISYLVPPKGVKIEDIPEELRCYCREGDPD